MNVKGAIALMVQYPAVDFPWQRALINLVNACSSPDRQLDPLTAEAKEVQDAINSMDASLQEMVYNSSLDSVNVTEPVPAPVVVMKDGRSHLLVFFAVTLCLTALMMTLKVGNGATGSDVVEILKLFLSLIGPQPAT